MGEKATLMMARQELEDLYLSVPDNSVDLTFRDLLPPPSVAASDLLLDDDYADERNNKALLRSSTNIFTYKLELGDGGGGGKKDVPAGLQLTPSPPPHHHHHRSLIRSSAGVEQQNNKKQQQHPPVHITSSRAANYKRPGIPHSNICALCTDYVYLFRHRCLVCGRVYCRRCVAAGMGDMTEGRKCIDCLGRRYSHRYIHRAGGSLTTGSGFLCCCLWGYYPNATSVKAQELVWAEKGPAPRRRPRPSSSSTSTSISTSYAGGGASMSMTMMSSNNNMMMTINGGNNSTSAPPAAASASSSFVASFSPNPHAFPL